MTCIPRDVVEVLLSVCLSLSLSCLVTVDDEQEIERYFYFYKTKQFNLYIISEENLEKWFTCRSLNWGFLQRETTAQKLIWFSPFLAVNLVIIQTSSKAICAVIMWNQFNKQPLD